MKTAEIKIGGTYRTLVSGKLRTVIVIEQASRPDPNGRPRFLVADASGRPLPKTRTAAALREV